MLGSSKKFKPARNDTHWLAFGVSETLIVVPAMDLRNLVGFRVWLPDLPPPHTHTIIEVLHYNPRTASFRLKIQKAQGATHLKTKILPVTINVHLLNLGENMTAGFWFTLYKRFKGCGQTISKVKPIALLKCS